jgi:maleamate amidohydrolase
MNSAPQPSAQDADYAAAGLGTALEWGRRPAFVLVDPVTAYTDPSCGLYAGVEEPVEGMRALLGLVRTAGIPVFVTRVQYRPDGSDGGVFFRKVPALAAYLPGSPYGAFIDGLEPRESETVITKQYPSAFFGTSLGPDLVARGIDTLLIAGLSTSGCVRATAMDAMVNGFVPVVVEDAVGDRDPAVHAANLFDISKKIGEVATLADVAAYLAR